MKWYKLILLSLLTGLLLSLSWYPHGLPFLIFFSWIPMFFMSDALLKKGSRASFWKGLLYSYPGFLLWNAITTYWICYCTVPGGIAAVVLNALLESLVFGFWQSCRRSVRAQWTHPIMFAAFWMSFEYLHLNWDLTWPWLNLGNVFAVCPHCVQWYSITGVCGGTLWIITINFLLFYLIKNLRQNNTRCWILAGSAFLSILIPLLISAIQLNYFKNHIDKSTPVEAIVVQPNTDVWNEQFHLSNYTQAERILEISKPYINENTNLVVCPESCLPHSVSMMQIKSNNWPGSTSLYGGFALIDSMIAQYPNLHFVLGLSTYDIFNHKATQTAQSVGVGTYIDLYNTAICYSRNQYEGHHHKSKLVPGVEALPFPKIFGFLQDLLVDLGGSHGSLGKDNGYRTFPVHLKDTTIQICTSICYESIYGEHTAHFVKNGANLLTITTNDSWWDDSPGHIQHAQMARLRAIENRRYVLRSANGGISSIIDPMGDIMQHTEYMERTVMKEKVYAQFKQTFYSQHGDYLAWIAIFLSGCFVLLSLVERFIKIINHHHKKYE